ncbi:MAG: thiamine-phosphate kinase, partial [Sphingomonadales bacterium]|nr:thiamine-phosphate kinase [Sphingomonadales bacterium]
QLALGRKLAPLVSAMMDISDGLLIDARRMAAASKVAITIESIDIPLSPEFTAVRGDTREASIAAATMGDDYGLLFTAPARSRKFVESAAEETGVAIRCVGLVEAGSGIALQEGGRPLELPSRLGWEF